MEQSKFDNFFDVWFYPVAKWVMLAIRITCGVTMIIQAMDGNKFLFFVFLVLAILIYITDEMFDGYRWKRYVDADTGNRKLRRLKKKFWNRAKKKHGK